MQRFLLAVLMILMGAAVAQAQVAAPSLTPSAPNYTFLQQQHTGGTVPLNPAATQWALQSHVAIGQTEYLQTDLASVPPLDTEMDGLHAGLLWTTEYFAVAGDRLELEGGTVDNQTDTEVTASQTALSVRPFEFLSVGYGVRKFELVQSQGVIESTLAREEPLTGLGLRLWENFFFGYSSGTETLDLLLTFGGVPLASFTVERDVSAWGVALRTVGPTRWHIEYYTLEREFGQDTLGNSIREESDETLVLEAVLSDAWLLGLAATDFTSEFPGSALGPLTTEVQRISLGYTPPTGVSVVLTRITEDGGDTVTSLDQTTDSISLLYRF